MGAKLTAPQRRLLEAVRDGQCHRWGAVRVTALLPGQQHWQVVTARLRTLDTLGLVDPFGTAMPEGKRFPDYHVVHLTDAGREALVEASR